MPLGRGIVEVFEAIPDRIVVSGHGPTWKVTGGSFESVLGYVHEAFEQYGVLGREDRTRWWPRVTLTVTTDPTLMEQALPLETFADDEDASFVSPLEEIFAHQEELRQARRRLADQRASDRDPASG